MKAVLVSNIPAPYREPVYEQVAQHYQPGFAVIYCKASESDRKWSVDLGDYPKHFLRGTTFQYKRIYQHHVHWNPGIWRELNRLNPEIVITNGYNPTHLLAFLWSIIYKRKHIAMTDGWIKSEEHLFFIHKLARKIVLRHTHAFVGASLQSLELFLSYGAKKEALFVSRLCANNVAFFDQSGTERVFDVMFSGQFIDRKMPGFFCEVVRKLQEKRKNLRVLLLGDGPEKQNILNKLDEIGVSYTYPGFVDQKELPRYYASAKLLLFPTKQECWGVVVNEACAAGTPVVTCTNTAAVGELIINKRNGLVVELEANRWTEEVSALLDSPAILEKYSQTAKEMVQAYTYKNAAQGILDALNYVSSQK